MLRFLLTVLMLFALFCAALGSNVRGVVKSESGELLHFANVYVKNSTYGVATNIKGEYFLELAPGTYTLTYSYLGCQTLEQKVVLAPKQSLVLNVKLPLSAAFLHEIEIGSDKRDQAREIMKQVRDERKKYLDRVVSYSCKTYTKTSIEKDLIKGYIADTLNPDTTEAADLKLHYKKEKLNMIESLSKTYFREPGKYHETILAHHDYAEMKPRDGERTLSLSLEYGENEIIPESFEDRNANIVYHDISTCEFNFYKNLIDYPSLLEKPLLSPLASSSALSYSFIYDYAFFEQGKKIHKIEVIPRNPVESLFKGYIFIEDSTWALVSVDLSINSSALQFCRDFRIIQNYLQIDSCYVPVRREMNYTIRDGKFDIIGEIRIDHSNYFINDTLNDDLFSNEVKTYDPLAFNKDSTFWIEQRPVTLKDNELEFIKKSDSIQQYYVSDAYFAKIDSQFNKITWWAPLIGVGHRYRKTGVEWYLGGLLQQVNPVGIGGYRHKLPLYVNKEFKNAMLLETEGFVDYGFRNKDVKGKVSVGLTYIPLKFVRTKLIFGSYYEMINPFSSFEQVFSGSNWVHSKEIGIAQRMEIVNGLYGEWNMTFTDQNPLSDIQMSSWSEYLFGRLNQATDFVRYTKLETSLEFKYRFNQKYVIKGKKKYIIGTEFPELKLFYRRGIPGVFKSEVDFEYLELGAKDEMQLGRFGSSGWQVFVGAFTNRNNLRLLEHKFFRGSDRFYFSDPLKSFQLLGLTMNTRSQYFRANYVHHFEGWGLNQIPLLNRLKLSMAAGAGALIIREEDFAHIELFGGIEKVIRIKKQLFRLGVYAVTSDNNLKNADYTFKVGISFWNPYTSRWEN